MISKQEINQIVESSLSLSDDITIADSFKWIIYNNKNYLFGKEEYLNLLLKIKGQNTEWIFSPTVISTINNELIRHGEELNDFHIYYLPTNEEEITLSGEYKWITKDEIKLLSKIELSEEAFLYDDDSPDELGIAYLENGKILGLAGASRNYEKLYEIGVHVDEFEAGRGIAQSLISKLKVKLLSMGIVPFYGTSMSHFASQNVAIKAGFKPSFIVVTGE